jgi:hypothetical protein
MQEFITVPRSRVFVLKNGIFVVQWEENRVQDLVNGKYINYSEDDFGSAIHDYELAQLKTVGCVWGYDVEQVFLSDMPMALQQNGRSYYLHTQRPKSEHQTLQKLLKACGFYERFSSLVREDVVVIRGKDGIAFSNFDEAERARELIVRKCGDSLMNVAVAFVEVNAEI